MVAGIHHVQLIAVKSGGGGTEERGGRRHRLPLIRGSAEKVFLTSNFGRTLGQGVGSELFGGRVD